MRAQRVKAFAAAAFLSSVGLASAAAGAGGDTALRDISDYRGWERVATVAAPSQAAAAGG